MQRHAEISIGTVALAWKVTGPRLLGQIFS